ncbi:MAG: hypothetical protein CBC13_03000 [Planctomycetia bacterium TMED53]|nr:MAG: hypothetical protein CBC13_03000 [Planctomycetia bacterium TMED53]
MNMKLNKNTQNESDIGITPVDGSTAAIKIGIDLGTSRSAICSSKGERLVMASVVGWPKDAVSAKVFGRRVLVGDAVLENRMALKTCFPLANGNLAFSGKEGQEQETLRKAGLHLFSALRMAANPNEKQAVHAVIGAPAEATRENKQAIIDLAREAGIEGVMVVSEPFAVAYALDALEDAMVVDIGAGTIDLCRMAGSLPGVEDQLTVFHAGNDVDARICELIREKRPEVQFSRNMIKQAKERFSSVVDTNKRAMVRFPVNGKPTEIDITAEIASAVGELVPHITEGIQKLVSSFDPEFQHRIRNRVIVSGGGSQVYGLQEALEKGLAELGGGNVEIVDDPVYAGAQGALKLAQEMPEEYWQQLGEDQ